MAKTRRTRGEAALEQKRFAELGESGGTVNLCADEDGGFVILEGMPHVEVPGATIPDALRALAQLIEDAS